ncbi:MAG: complex I NDUFA9 subunit family protein [Pseudomonadota bacterium]
MITDSKIVCVFGGTGFLGQAIVDDLAEAGFRVKIATRNPESAYELKVHGNVGQIASAYCDYRDEQSIDQAIEGCDFVINLIGILFEKGKNSFTHAHVDIPTQIAKSCTKHKVQKLIHVSALGIDENQSKYAKSKLKGEVAIKENFPDVTIFRPSIIFGPDDSFFNLFARLSSILPALPLIGGGQTKFQPIYVGDIAKATIATLLEPSDKFKGEVIEMGGPDIVSFKEIYEILLEQTKRKRLLLPLPFPIATLQGKVMGLLPQPPLTADQVTSLKFDNVISGQYKTIDDIGLNPTPMSVILPTYLKTYRKGGRFAEKNDTKIDDKKAS